MKTTSIKLFGLTLFEVSVADILQAGDKVDDGKTTAIFKKDIETVIAQMNANTSAISELKQEIGIIKLGIGLRPQRQEEQKK